MAISWKGDAAFTIDTSSLNTFSPVMPTHAAGDLLIAMWAGKPFDAGVSVTGWTSLGSGASGTTASAADLGSVKVQVWYKEATSASETAPSMVEGSPTWAVSGGGVSVWQ